MLRLHRLEVEDFGPFRGKQEICFPRDAGVTVIRGENMHGKTSVLNALRFALFGKVLGRGSRPIPIHQLINWATSEEGNHRLSVSLEFAFEDEEYELRRRLKPRSGVGIPAGEADYETLVTLTRGGVVLSPEQTEREMARIMPLEIARFFLFDGELLQEYEDLLLEETSAGFEIKRAIERILGLPVLTNARRDLETVVNDVGKQESKEAQKDAKTQQIGSALQALQESRKHHEREVTRLQGEEDGLKAEESELNLYLNPQEAVRALIEKKAVLKSDMGRLRNERAQNVEDLRGMLSDAWRWVAGPVLEERAHTLRSQIDILEGEIEHARVSTQADLMRSSSLAAEECTLCGQHLDAGAKQHLSSMIEDMDDDIALKKESVAALQRKAVLLEALQPDTPASEARRIMEANRKIDVNYQTMKDDLADVDEDLAAFDEKSIASAIERLKRIVQELQTVQKAKRDEREAAEKDTQNIRGLQDKLDKIGSISLERLRRKRLLAESLKRLFGDSVDVYRSLLQVRVEKDATDLFLKLTTEREYGALSINDKYGLSIIHSDGTPVTVRSAGAEHIVALSLMGALQKNAPLKGPIVMDSPFGRLDEQHTNNVIAALPAMAEQAVLLVYEKEVDIDSARAILAGRIRAEYLLRRVSAKETRIEKA